MALDTLNNGDSGLEARAKINAAVSAVTALQASTGLRGVGTLKGFTVTETYPSQATGFISLASWSGAEGSVVIGNISEQVTFDLAHTNPELGNVFIDLASYTTADSILNFMQSVIAGSYTTITASYISDGVLYLQDSFSFGVDSVLNITSTANGMTSSGHSQGDVGSPPSGALGLVELIPAQPGKLISIHSLLAQTLSAFTMDSSILIGYGPAGDGFVQLMSLNMSSHPTSYDLESSGAQIDSLTNPACVGLPLVASIGGTIPTGGEVRIMVHAIPV